MIKSIINALKQVRFSQLAFTWEMCHCCGWMLQVKTYDDEMGVRCTRCFATPVSQSMVCVFKQQLKPHYKNIYELSSRGAFVRFLKKQKLKLTLSEYFDGVELGEFVGGIQCQNVEKLTYTDNKFDVVTSLEVFEHVENDMQGFKEIHRVLKRKGVFIFTVPINLESKTIERTKIVNGKHENILPAMYHSDSLRGANKVFCYRDYGFDIVERLRSIGFAQCEIIKLPKAKLFGYYRPVIIASKG